MVQKKPTPESPRPVEIPPEAAEPQAAAPENASTEPLSSGSIQQTVSKELKELVKSYVEYAKNVDL
ncbi:hypothetical protein [Sporomusa termitida]|uniref:Uncharacterized protein n=1 Tax=Sporomusa termitida TaxID=2377 RepID=A0A517DQL0_9FIRM|nr:hypothetical protein [Sporomusa termitida]QDR79649.1 hypothetical protein SPTER_09380 [Sporomusa termitida]